MMRGFDCLAEFEALRNDEKADMKAAEAILDRLCFQKMNLMLSGLAPIRMLGIRLWINELNKIGNGPITLRTTDKEITPYMHEDGVICLCKKDVHRVERLLMIFAHETAHFVLMRDENYASIKAVDRESEAIYGCENKMKSPVELCANLITLKILERCQNAEKCIKKQKKIKSCIKTLEKQLT